MSSTDPLAALGRPPMPIADFTYGQIRPSNFEFLRRYYQHDPPWPMREAPHVDCVRAVIEGRDPGTTTYAEYLRATHVDAAASLARSIDTIHVLLRAEALAPITAEGQSVTDGNHRWAVAHVTGRALRVGQRQPYQTVRYPDGLSILGRRLPDRFPLDYDFTGKTVLDLGCAQGMNAVEALRAGARHATLVDADLTSTTWELLAAWGLTARATVRVCRIEDCPPIAADVVLAFSVQQHVEPAAVRRIIEGRDCLFETHAEGQPPPATPHRWTHLRSVSYSRAEPGRSRDLWLGTWGAR